ncbi:hypothetical protein K2173_026010 [Erythroxylum novogranatense]|uniref:Uncharacterized protein n=1 Tax=Erythroxylum novogranatense TaxID=1862640 RepID=A0AAV8SHX4_9ROSI|nr:hypothetical protein K2173_026010 [Erythroxylum novogranatense]
MFHIGLDCFRCSLHSIKNITHFLISDTAQLKSLPFKSSTDGPLFQRPPGPISSSMLGLEAITGTLEDFSVEDYMLDPRDSEALRPADLHHGMEVRLGISKGPACPIFI